MRLQPLTADLCAAFHAVTGIRRTSEETMTDDSGGCRLIGATELNELLQGEGEIALLDVREELSFGQAHILYASCMPLSRKSE